MSSKNMFSNKENVNILTSLLVNYDIENAVVCPGSRNAPIVHNLVVCPQIICHSVTDERSAGYYALGMALATQHPVVVCVTSGTALLNLLPAVAEAYYQHVPLVVISADRPPQWIDQLDGQTISQPHALGCFVKKAVSLPEPHNDEERWYCERLIKEALEETYRHQVGFPVHINIPISEPLYAFTEKNLPTTHRLHRTYTQTDIVDLDKEVIKRICKAKRPMIVVGQACDCINLHNYANVQARIPILNECLSNNHFLGATHFEEVLHVVDKNPRYKPDFVIYMGEAIVSKQLKQFLRSCTEAEIWRVSPTGELCDTFMNLTGIAQSDMEEVLYQIDISLEKRKTIPSLEFYTTWKNAQEKARNHAENYLPAYSQMAAVRCLKQTIAEKQTEAFISYGNGLAIRLANIYAQHHVYCNRGINGIEGTLSTAAGMSVVRDEGIHFCVLGDLSFFYDSNALWNEELHENLRVLLLNNGGGGIFEKFEGLKESPAREQYVMAKHQNTAEGICKSYRANYRAAHNMKEMKDGIKWLVSGKAEIHRPMVLEVFTDSASDAEVMRDYYHSYNI
jgi:2-succinyl-5-enolpyruvyl-6-hydroxy-3-cyclohexene-1-carboxylate synthase